MLHFAKNRKNDSLSNTAFFANQTLQSVKSAAQASIAVRSTLAPEDFQDNPILIISSGVVGSQHVLEDGRRSISTIFLPGDVLDVEQNSASYNSLIALTPVKAHMFETAAFEKLRRDNPEMSEALASSYYMHCSHTAMHCADLARKSAVEKLASFIFECRSRQMAGQAKNVSLLLKRIDIADYMGLRPETLSRAFARLREMQLISFDDRNHVLILNEASLSQVANGGNLDQTCAE